MRRSPLFWVRYALLLILGRVARWLGCVVFREAAVREAVAALTVIARARHAIPLGKKGSIRRKEDDYIAHVLLTLKRGMLPR